jgi:predicted ester cyclase
MILQQYFEEVWNKGNLAAIDELTCPDAVIHTLISGGGETAHDLASFKKLFEPMLASLSDVRVELEVVMCADDLEAARCVITAVHYEDAARSMERCKPIHFTGMSMVRLRDRRIEESWNSFDFETMYLQME